MITIEAAERLARRAHVDQVNSLGDPTFTHVMRVAEQVALDSDDLAVVVAILHDTVEKGSLDWNDLIEAGVSPEQIEILDLVTERDDESQAAYLGRCASHPVARRVKEADLRDKLDPRAGRSLPPEALEKKRRRARRRLAILNAGSAEASVANRARSPLV